MTLQGSQVANQQCADTASFKSYPCPQDLAQKTDAALMELSTLDQEVKSARQMIADATKAGTEIYEGLGKEKHLKEARQRAIAKQTDKADVERAIQVP